MEYLYPFITGPIGALVGAAASILVMRIKMAPALQSVVNRSVEEIISHYSGALTECKIELIKLRTTVERQAAEIHRLTWHVDELIRVLNEHNIKPPSILTPAE